MWDISIVEMLLLVLLSLVAAILSGFAGFGGALLLLPLLVTIFGAKSAIPILTLAQLFGNASRVYFGRKELAWKYIKVFLLGAIPATVLGALTLWYLDAKLVRRLLGLFLIAWVIYRKIKPSFREVGNKSLFIGGAATGLISGAVGSAGPLGAALFLSLGLAPTAYIASEAVTALSMHIMKLILYPTLKLMHLKEFLIGILLGGVMIVGSYFGKKIAQKFSPVMFQWVVEGLLLISGMGMVI